MEGSGCVRVSQRKGLELKLGGCRWRSWSSKRVVQDSSAMARVEAEIEQQRRFCWANLPPELLREVLVRIERSEGCWPLRGNVVACAGVCKSWRDIMKEIVKTPELSGKLTFPISVKQPGPRESMIKCFIKRNRATQSYHLYLSLTNALAEDGKFLLSARKFRRATCNDYVVSLHPDDMSKGGGTYIGKLRLTYIPMKKDSYEGVAWFKFRNRDGMRNHNMIKENNIFMSFETRQSHAGTKMTKSRSTRLANLKQVAHRASFSNQTVAHISYELNVLGSRGPRKMVCTMGSIPESAVEPGGVAPTQTELPISSLDSFPSLPFFRSRSNCTDDKLSGPPGSVKDEALILRNKTPRWHDQLQCWCLNFHGRVTVASVKNFQLVASPENGPEHDKIILQFGKVGKDVFTMDYCYPISAFQAFAICLSSFDTKIACE